MPATVPLLVYCQKVQFDQPLIAPGAATPHSARHKSALAAMLAIEGSD